MYYKVLYHDPQNLIDYAKWLNAQHEESLEIIAVNGPYHICVASQPDNSTDAERCIHCNSGEEIPSAFNFCPYCGRKLRR